jgi:hypothetical protein
MNPIRDSRLVKSHPGFNVGRNANVCVPHPGRDETLPETNDEKNNYQKP